MQEGQLTATAPLFLRDKITQSYAKGTSTLVIASQRRCGKSSAIAQLASEVSARGEDVVVFVTCKRNGLWIRDALVPNDSGGIIAIVVADAAYCDTPILRTFRPDCILIDDLAHIEPRVFFTSIVPAMMQGKPGGLTLFCVSDNSGLMKTLSSVIGSHFRVVNFDGGGA